MICSIYFGRFRLIIADQKSNFLSQTIDHRFDMPSWKGLTNAHVHWFNALVLLKHIFRGIQRSRHGIFNVKLRLYFFTPPTNIFLWDRRTKNVEFACMEFSWKYWWKYPEWIFVFPRQIFLIPTDRRRSSWYPL